MSHIACKRFQGNFKEQDKRETMDRWGGGGGGAELF